MKSVLYASVAAAALVLAYPAMAEVPTGYKVAGCKDYKIDPTTWRVTQVCKDTTSAFWERLKEGNSEAPTESEASEGGGGSDGEGDGGSAE